MDNNFLHHWSIKTGCSYDDTVLYAQSIIKWITSNLIENGQLRIAGFGKFNVQKHLEYVEKDKKSNKRVLYPPKLTVEFVPVPFMEEADQENSVLNQLTDMLVNHNHVPLIIAEKLPISFFKSILEMMDDKENVEVEGLGSFLLTKVKVGDSVYGKVAFFPDESLSSVINGPFSFFSPVELVDGVHFNDLEEKGVTNSEKESQDNVFLISKEQPIETFENTLQEEGNSDYSDKEKENNNESALIYKPNELDDSDTNQMENDDKEGTGKSKRLFYAFVVFAIACALLVWQYFKRDNNIQNESDNIAYTDTFIEKAIKDDTVSLQKEKGKIDQVPASLDFAAMNAQIPYGGYDIVGVASTIKVVPGMTLQKIAQIYLGTEHTIYLEVLNEGKEPMPGQAYKIPKLQLRKR